MLHEKHRKQQLCKIPLRADPRERKGFERDANGVLKESEMERLAKAFGRTFPEAGVSTKISKGNFYVYGTCRRRDWVSRSVSYT